MPVESQLEQHHSGQVNSAIGPAGRLALKPAMPGLPIAGIHQRKITPSVVPRFS